MTDALEQYRRLIESMPAGIVGGVEILLGQMDPYSARVLRMSAIPHQFDPGILEILEPGLNSSQAEMVCHKFSDLAFVGSLNGTLVIHDEVRSYLFKWWLKPDNHREFRDVSARLANYFEWREKELTGDAGTSARLQWIFHLIGADQAAGFAQFEQQFRQDRYRFRLHTCETAVNLVREYEPVLDREHKLWFWYHQAELMVDLRRYEDARQALTNLLQSDGLDPRLRARSLYRLATVHDRRHEWAQAIDIYKEGLALIERHPEADDQKLRLLQGLATAYREIDQPELSEVLLQNCIQLAEAINGRSALAEIYNSLGNLHRKLGQTSRAIEAFRKSLQYLTQRGEQFRPAQVYNNLGLIHADRTEWELARESLEKSLGIYRQAGDTHGQAVALSNLVRVYLNLHRHSDAVQAGEQAIEWFLQVHDWFRAARTSQGLGRFYRRQNRLSEARAFLVKAEDLFRQSGALEQAEEAKAEMERLGNRRRLPWYAWGVIIILILCVLLMIMALGS